jgi:hypothetical protein
MKSLLVILALVVVGITSAKLNENQKENFFEFMNDHLEGRGFLSTLAQRIMDRAQHHLLFNLYPVRSVAQQVPQVGDFLQCQTCKLTVSGLDASIRSQVVTQALEEFSIMVCH